jgi:hypothetical protein
VSYPRISSSILSLSAGPDAATACQIRVIDPDVQSKNTSVKPCLRFLQALVAPTSAWPCAHHTQQSRDLISNVVIKES